MIKNRDLLSLVALPFVFHACNDKPDHSRPNIVLISADDLGWSDLGCYGSEVHTPNLDKLAQEGIRMRHFCNTSKCFPSRACLLTGVYAQDCGYGKVHTNPIQNAVTLGEVLRDAGYATYWSGKHHGRENPVTRGFDRYYGLKDGACNHFNPGKQREGEKPPANKGRIRTWCIDSSILEPYTPEEKDFYTTDYFTNYALKYLEKAKQNDKPFFLYLAYTAPHDPLMAWPEDIKKYNGKYDEGYEAIRKKRYQKQLSLGIIDSSYTLSKPNYNSWENLSENKKVYEADKMEVYAAMIDRMDQNIGRLINRLEALELLENTLIIFVSDNGASAEVVNLDTDDDSAPVGSMERWVSLGKNWANVCNTPFRYYKNFSYEGGINTPFIAWWPEKIEAGSFSDFPGHFIDFMATFMELAEASYPEVYKNEQITSLKGKNLLPALLGLEENRDSPLFWEWGNGSAMRLNEWKIVKLHPDSAWNLYNLVVDPAETNNLTNNYPNMVVKLDSIFKSWLTIYKEK